MEDPQARWYLHNVDPAGEVIVDVGANVGRLSQVFWDHGDDLTRVVSIEPLPQNLERLRARAASAGPRWQIHPCAVSDHDGVLRLQVRFTDDEGWNSAALESASTSPDSVLEIPCRRLSDLVPEATVVKVDIEGHEYPVLSEALPRLQHVHTWLLELHMVRGVPLETTLGALASHGFALFAAGMRRGQSATAWQNVPIDARLSWDRIPVAKQRADGGVFKMLHVIAKH